MPSTFSETAALSADSTNGENAMRTTTRIVTFLRSFALKGVDGRLPPGDYRVDTDEELIDGLSFLAYRRTATAIFLPSQTRSAVWREMVPVDPEDLATAEAADIAARQLG